MTQVLSLEGTCQLAGLLLSACLSPAVSLLKGAPISAMFLTPGVTPWKTTLPGVVNGANNPGIRVFEYDRATLSLQVGSPGSAGAQGGGRGVTTFPLSQLLRTPMATEHQEGQGPSTLMELRIRPLEASPNPATESGPVVFLIPLFALQHCHCLLPDFSASSTALR